MLLLGFYRAVPRARKRLRCRVVAGLLVGWSIGLLSSPALALRVTVGLLVMGSVRAITNYQLRITYGRSTWLLLGNPPINREAAMR